MSVLRISQILAKNKKQWISVGVGGNPQSHRWRKSVQCFECCLWSPSVPGNQCRVFVLWSAAVSRGTGHRRYSLVWPDSIIWCRWPPPGPGHTNVPPETGDRLGCCHGQTSCKTLKWNIEEFSFAPNFPAVPVFVTQVFCCDICCLMDIGGWLEAVCHCVCKNEEDYWVISPLLAISDFLKIFKNYPFLRRQ